MMRNGVDPVVAGLGRLAHPAPVGLFDQVFTGWLTAPSRLGDLFVAFTPDGVSFVRPAVLGGAAAFAQAFHERFDRPLRTADRAPAGLLPALRGRPGAAPRLDLRESSDFERDVLAATRRIPAGQVRPYAWIAREIGRPAAVRAVGSALSHNPVPLLVPCHRVIRSDGSIGGYMFGAGPKEQLLREENVDLDALVALARQQVHYLGSDTTGVVCFPTCHNARRITPRHRRGFRTIGTAVAEGYRPCLHCRPSVEAIPA